ncbi:MAG: hypothetical protein HPY76_02345, partial [Anaerolineae bacterium]|nr:hypothetical protein [Anaerolineae bacterium]
PNLIQLFGLMTHGSKLAFDPRTHRRATQRYQRLQFIHAAAGLLHDQPVEETTQRILEHLQNALKVMELARGQMELARLAQAGSTLEQLDGHTRHWLSEVLGTEKYQSIQAKAIQEIPTQDRETILRVLGRRLQNEAYRVTLVRSISNQWIDYLTQMEALRISIGLEAYGQRDPLVQYKSRATDLFKTLLGNIRLDVIGNLFRVQTGALPTSSGAQPAGVAPSAQGAASAPGNQAQPHPSGKKKRRRH